MMLYVGLLLYTLSLVLFTFSMSSPGHPGIELAGACLAVNTMVFGVQLARSIRKRR